jgi:hypothetical protein
VRLTTPRSQDGALKPASVVLSAGSRSLGSCSRATGWSAATFALARSVNAEMRRAFPKLGVERPCHQPARHGSPCEGFRIDAQRPEFAVGLRDEHSSDGIRLVALLPERKRQFAKPSLDAILLNVREVLTVYPWCALVGAALGKRMSQDVLSADLVVQHVAVSSGRILDREPQLYGSALVPDPIAMCNQFWLRVGEDNSVASAGRACRHIDEVLKPDYRSGLGPRRVVVG